MAVDEAVALLADGGGLWLVHECQPLYAAEGVAGVAIYTGGGLD